jgi:hypothetical protein
MSAYPSRSPFFAHKFVRLLHKSAVAAEIGRDALSLLVVIVHTEDAMRYRGPAKFWNSQLVETLGFKKWEQFDAVRKKAVAAGWLQYECNGKRSAGEYFVTIPDGYEAIDDSPIEESSPKSGYDQGYKDGYRDGLLNANTSGNGIRSGVRNPDDVGDEVGYEQGEPSIPIPYPIPSLYSPGEDIVVPERMRTTAVMQSVGLWFRHLQSKDKHNKVPMRNSPQEQAWWHEVAKMGADGFCSAVQKSMAEGWVVFQDKQEEQSVKHNGSNHGKPTSSPSTAEREKAKLQRILSAGSS